VVVADAFGNVIHRGAPAEFIPRLLKKLADWNNDNKGEYPPLVLAAVFIINSKWFTPSKTETAESAEYS